MNKKRFYPDPESPTLLTWSEKQTMRHLYDSDPGEWTAQKLSECFPAASENIVKEVIKNRSPPKMNAAQANEHDETVRRNWRLLTQGKLNDRLGEDLHNHLVKSGSLLVKGGNFSNLPESSLRQLEETMLQMQNNESEETFRITAKSAKGPFGSIITEYEKKVQSKLASQAAAKGQMPASNVIEGRNLLREGDETYDHGPKHARDPRRGTSLINVDIDLKEEIPMTMKTFKKIFAKNLKNDANIVQDSASSGLHKHLKSSPIAEVAKQFLTWLDTEQRKDLRANHYIGRDSASKEHLIVKPKNRRHSSIRIENPSAASIDINTPQNWSQSKWIKTIVCDHPNGEDRHS